jgi:hypothetical protein
MRAWGVMAQAQRLGSTGQICSTVPNDSAQCRAVRLPNESAWCTTAGAARGGAPDRRGGGGGAAGKGSGRLGVQGSGGSRAHLEACRQPLHQCCCCSTRPRKHPQPRLLPTPPHHQMHTLTRFLASSLMHNLRLHAHLAQVKAPCLLLPAPGPSGCA